MKYCDGCNQIVSSDAKHCPNCGWDVFLTEEKFEAKRQFLVRLFEDKPHVFREIMGDEV